MGQVILNTKTLYQHIIHVHLHHLSYLLHKYLVHQPLVRGSCILEPKGHYCAVVKPLIDDRKDVFLVELMHLDLVVI